MLGLGLWLGLIHFRFSVGNRHPSNVSGWCGKPIHHRHFFAQKWLVQSIPNSTFMVSAYTTLPKASEALLFCEDSIMADKCMFRPQKRTRSYWPIRIWSLFHFVWGISFRPPLGISRSSWLEILYWWSDAISHRQRFWLSTLDWQSRVDQTPTLTPKWCGFHNNPGLSMTFPSCYSPTIKSQRSLRRSRGVANCQGHLLWPRPLQWCAGLSGERRSSYFLAPMRGDVWHHAISLRSWAHRKIYAIRTCKQER